VRKGEEISFLRLVVEDLDHRTLLHRIVVVVVEEEVGIEVLLRSNPAKSQRNKKKRSISSLVAPDLFITSPCRASVSPSFLYLSRLCPIRSSKVDPFHIDC